MMPTTRRTTKTYGHYHRLARAKWQRIINRGEGVCHATLCLEPNRAIPPGTPWDLGHTPDGTRYNGPEHTRCNRSEGATRGNKTRRTPERWIL
jgi:hypothetical protein